VFGLEILAHINFFSLKSSRAFRNAPHSRLRCRDPNQCLPNFLMMLLLTLAEIYTRVLHLWKSIDLDSVWVGDSRPYQLFFFSRVLVRLEIMAHSRFRCRDPKQCLSNFLKMLLLALPQIYTRVFHLWKYIDLYSTNSHLN